MASHANRICPPACCPNVQRDDKILRLSASWCSPPEKIAPPQTIAPQKVFLGGAEENTIFRVFAWCSQKTAATDFQIITFT